MPHNHNFHCYVNEIPLQKLWELKTYIYINEVQEQAKVSLGREGGTMLMSGRGDTDWERS